jgi:sulfatase modifying factor 1
MRLWGVVALGLIAVQASADNDMAKITAGSYTPLFKADDAPQNIAVSTFLIDKYPVTNEQFTAFVGDNPAWRKHAVKPIFADQNYLAQLGDNSLENSQQPVTNVSWFASRAYCKAQGKRLPTTDEWEYAGQASATKANGRGDSEQQKLILDWYAKPASEMLTDVQQTPVNYWGVYGLHGAVWEWVNDYNNILSTGESRGDSQLEQELYCGAGAAASVDPSDYAAFMRYAFRSSLQANYTLASLGFRCAQNVDE